ncbi:ribosome maturation factor RimP [Corynebacterium tapiri]|uniref:Ribosome maturation factor RimP n=1 Tax=Corynebacterium tapiri TaxID=1448266 RepID=A0A5C4U5A8_9CORY|nr:ribosome maturation factor RimP [Corynebacterium tapiri]TNL99268.1 ribosome maturation factor RimP [Corynebacterium tapiri]
MAFPTNEQLRELVAPVVASHGMDIEAIKASPAGKKSKVEIKVDADERPTLDTLELVSADISAAFDAAEEQGSANFGAGYTLEVSTPGVDTPLTHPRHWRRNRHRKVRIDGATYRIGALNPEETSVVLIGAKQSVQTHSVSSEQKAVVDIEFNQAPDSELKLTAMTYDEALEWGEDNK